MDLTELESIVRQCLAPFHLHIESEVADHRELVVRMEDRSSHPARPIACITDHRTDRFSLELEQTYVFQEFEYIEADQPEIVRGLCGVVAACLRGEGERGWTTKRFGFFGRIRPTYRVVVDGTYYMGEGDPIRSS